MPFEAVFGPAPDGGTRVMVRFDGSPLENPHTDISLFVDIEPGDAELDFFGAGFVVEGEDLRTFGVAGVEEVSVVVSAFERGFTLDVPDLDPGSIVPSDAISATTTVVIIHSGQRVDTLVNAIFPEGMVETPGPTFEPVVGIEGFPSIEPIDRGSLEVEVVDTSGGPLAGVAVSVAGQNIVTGTDGRATATELTPGTYDVTVDLEGYVAASLGGVEVGPGEDATVEAVLRAVGEATTPSTVAISSTTTQTTLAGPPPTLPGEETGSGGFPLMGVLGGVLALALILVGLRMWRRRREPDRPEQMPGPSGSLACRVQPSRADLVVGGTAYGKFGGRVLITSLDPGRYTIVASLEGFVPQTARVAVEPQRPAAISFHLVPTAEAVRARFTDYLTRLGEKDTRRRRRALDKEIAEWLEDPEWRDTVIPIIRGVRGDVLPSSVATEIVAALDRGGPRLALTEGRALDSLG